MPKKQKSIGVNAALNAIKAGLSVLFPLITFPYATRVLGVENLGKVNYGLSIEHYFSLLAALGVTTYAVREGAKRRDNRAELADLCNEVFTLRLFTTFCSYCVLAILLLFSIKLREYRLLIALQSISIFFTAIGVDWLNTIHEDYLYITLRSIATNLISMIALFLFVKGPEDYYIYALLTVLVNSLISITNLIYCRRYMHLKLCISKRIFGHLKSTFIFFANSVSVSIYVSADTTMLGWICGDYTVGIYTAAVKVYNIVKTMLASVYIVAIPRLSNYAGHERYDDFKQLYSKLITYLALLLLPSIAGLISLASDIIMVISGENYMEAVLTLQILSVALMFAIFGGAVTNCLNVPLKRELCNLKTTFVCAATNVILNLYFIPHYQQNGAAFTSLISELMVLVISIMSYRNIGKFINLKYILTNLLHGGVGMVTVFITCYLVSFVPLESRFLSLLIKIVASVLLYVFELILLKNSCISELILFLKRRTIKRGK